ncbi:hypothetical protein HORIV_19780 [Vreelandella olivaria]|uniref:Uncharacterized protein n=1 Tax=Vreelandella olivaria TaxID=390919 RepID=A0ABN5WRP7_9GAMM|nr:hypothetical protein HORIV_19780 [Halomonas olivaria]
MLLNVLIYNGSLHGSFDSAEATPSDDAPLAFRMRPRQLDDYVGQQALVGPDKPLRRMAESGVVRSMILWGHQGRQNHAG